MDITNWQNNHKSTRIYANAERIKENSKGVFLDNKDRIFIPSEVAKAFLRDLHILLEHPGGTKLYKTIRRIYFIQKIKQLVNDITAECLKCCTCRERTNKYGFIKGFLQGKYFLEIVSTDIFGPIKAIHFNNTKNKKKFYIITFTDLFSRLTTVDILFNISAEAVVKSMKLNLFERMGVPKKILSDQGRQYISETFKEILKQNNVQHILTSPHNPTGNSVSERINKTIADICRIYKGVSIYRLKRLIENRINHTYHRALNLSPHETVFKYSKLDPLKRELNNHNKSIMEVKINEDSIKK